jgi:hypothetical protein
VDDVETKSKSKGRERKEKEKKKLANFPFFSVSPNFPLYSLQLRKEVFRIFNLLDTDFREKRHQIGH